MLKNLPAWRLGLFLSLILLAPMSKYPSFALPVLDFPSFRIGLYQLLAVAFVGLCAWPMWQNRQFYLEGKNPWVGYSLLALAALGITSVSWSLYPARSALLALSLALLVLVVLAAWWYVAHELPRGILDRVVRLMLIAGVAYGLFALAQFAVYTFTDLTLGVQCRGCVPDVFGFPRVNGFAAEPQFFANAMLPFVFAALYALFTKPSRLAWAALLLSTGAIGLTFSRGAFAALAAGLLALLAILNVRRAVSIRRILQVIAAIAISILVSLALLVAVASIRYSSTPNIIYETIDTIGEHLTLGILNLPERAAPPAPANPTPEETFVSPGLIEASNEERTGAAELALKAWASGFMTAMLGVGIGNLGPFVVANIDAGAPENLTVYIYYVLVLAELGMIGLLALLLVFGGAVRSVWHKPASLIALCVGSLIVSFAVQYLFFGTYINAVYTWLWLGIALGLPLAATRHSKPKKRIIQRSKA